MKFCLAFGCEDLSVPVMRRVLGDTLRGLGVEEESVYDILLAVSDACTGILGHGTGRYEVVTSLYGTGCQLEVTGPWRPGGGTVVIMRKHISWSWDAPLRRLAAAS